MTNPAALSALAKGDIGNFLTASAPGGIERQEAEGQRQMASSFLTLPKDMDREPGLAFGFTFGVTRDSRYPPYGRDPLGARFMGSGGAVRQSPTISKGYSTTKGWGG
jgi:hypothetical protein